MRQTQTSATSRQTERKLLQHRVKRNANFCNITNRQTQTFATQSLKTLKQQDSLKQNIDNNQSTQIHNKNQLLEIHDNLSKNIVITNFDYQFSFIGFNTSHIEQASSVTPTYIFI